MPKTSAQEAFADYTMKLAVSPDSENTGTFVDGSFFPGSRVTGGGPGSTTDSEQESLMQTPALPNANDAPGLVDSVKISAPQEVVPGPDSPEPGRTQPVGNLLQNMKKVIPSLPVVPADSTGKAIGRVGGGLAGGMLGAAASGAPGSGAMAPTAAGAIAGSGIGARIGDEIGEMMGDTPPPQMQEEQELQALLKQMKAQNPEFYQKVNREEVDEDVAEEKAASYDFFKLARQVPVEQPPPEEEGKSSLPWWVPLLAAGVLGGGAYGLARTPMLANAAKYPGLRKIQDLAKGKFRRADMIDFEGIDYAGLSKMDKLKRYLKYGPEVDAKGLVEMSKQKGGPAAVWQGSDMPMKGTFNPALGAETAKKKVGKIYDTIEDVGDDKLREAIMLGKHAPGTSARTMNIEDVLTKHKINLRPGKKFDSELARLQEALKKEFGEGYMIKTRGYRHGGDPNVASSGVFPTEATDLSKAYGQWKGMRKDFHKAINKDPNVNVAVERFRKQPGYEGRLVDEMLHDNAIVQAKLPLQKYTGRAAEKMKAQGYAPSKEFRVHVIGDKAVPSMAMPRYPSWSLRGLAETWKARKAARWAQKNVVDKLPGKYKGISQGMDIAPVKGGGYRVIETNMGGESGLLGNPLGAHGLYRAITGKHTKPVAGLIGAGAGAVGLGGGYAAREAFRKKRGGGPQGYPQYPQPSYQR